MSISCDFLGSKYNRQFFNLKRKRDNFLVYIWYNLQKKLINDQKCEFFVKMVGFSSKTIPENLNSHFWKCTRTHYTLVIFVHLKGGKTLKTRRYYNLFSQIYFRFYIWATIMPIFRSKIPVLVKNPCGTYRWRLYFDPFT